MIVDIKPDKRILLDHWPVRAYQDICYRLGEHIPVGRSVRYDYTAKPDEVGEVVAFATAHADAVLYTPIKAPIDRFFQYWMGEGMAALERRHRAGNKAVTVGKFVPLETGTCQFQAYYIINGADEIIFDSSIIAEYLEIRKDTVHTAAVPEITQFSLTVSKSDKGFTAVPSADFNNLKGNIVAFPFTTEYEENDTKRSIVTGSPLHQRFRGFYRQNVISFGRNKERS